MLLNLQLPSISYRKQSLSNGLDVILRRQAQVPLVAVNLWYHVGSKNEERRQRGFAHLFEHLMFEGSQHFPTDFFKPLQRLGAQVNGSTSADRTNYFETLPPAHLELALAMEADRMGFLLPALTPEKLQIQKGVVQNEYRQNYANRPYGQVGRLMAEALYPPIHPYSWLTIGAMEDLEAASQADVEAFFQRFYVPANASLCVVGDFDEDEALALIEKHFEDIPGGSRSIRPRVEPASLAHDLEIRLREPVELDRLYLSWHSVPQFHPDDAPLMLLGDLLARGKTSLLYRRLVLDLEIAQDVAAYQASRELAGTFGVVVTLRPGRSWREALDLIDQSIGELTQQVDSETLQRAQTKRLGAFLYALDNIGGFGGVADRLNAYNILLGDPGRITSDFDRFRQVAPEDVQRAATQYLARTGNDPARTASRALLVVEGSNRGRKAVGTDRETRGQIPVAPASRFHVPTVEVASLANGLPVWAVRRPDLPIISGTLVIRAGAGAHPSQMGGLATMTASMLDEGTSSRSALDLARELEDMASSLSSTSGWDGSYLGWKCLTPFLEPTLDLLADVLLRPSFPEDEWSRIHGRTLAQLSAQRDRAESLAYRAFLSALYPADHPYQTPSEGSLESVERLTLDSLREFHADRYRPDQAAIIVAGDIDLNAVTQWLNARLASWTGQATPLPVIPIPRSSSRRRLLLIHRPGASQAVVRVGHPGIARLDPQFTDLLVLNQILGGQFVSRLNARLREEKGITYGIRSGFDARRGVGPFAVSASLQTDRVAEALADIAHEIEALLGDRPPTETELADARRALNEGQANHFETPAELVSRLAHLFIHDLPADHFQTSADRIEAVTRDSALEAGSRGLQPFQLTAVVVADADQVQKPLEALGWAPVERIEIADLDR